MCENVVMHVCYAAEQKGDRNRDITEDPADVILKMEKQTVAYEMEVKKYKQLTC